MSKYIVTYMEYISLRGCNNGFFLCSTLKEVKDKILMLQNNKHFNISNIQIYAAEEITKFVNFIKEEICNTQ